MKKIECDLIVVGGGPAGLAAAKAASEKGSSVVLVEREERLGGILKQCIHDGFGAGLTGPEYAEKEIEALPKKNFQSLCETFVFSIRKDDDGSFTLFATNKSGVIELHSRSLVLATGCRERTRAQVFIHGTRPSGVFTAGQAQRLTNVEGLKVAKKVVILGSGDIGLIMARRLTLEGATVEGVYEAKSEPSGLKRNIAQCLNDFGIPLHLSHTVSRTFGRNRLEAVEIVKLDAQMRPIKGSERIVKCDTLILSVGLIPENEIATKLTVSLSKVTGGPIVDETLMTSVPGVFSAGNALMVNDLAELVTLEGKLAGSSAAEWARKQDIETAPTTHEITPGKNVALVIPQHFTQNAKHTALFLRPRCEINNAVITVNQGSKSIYTKTVKVVRPQQMVKLEIELLEKAPISVSINPSEEKR